MKKLVCKYCGEVEEYHHKFEAKMPDGCVCAPGEWTEAPPKPCKKFVGPDEYCHRCEHDRECHTEAT